MRYKCMVVDDEELARALLVEHLSHLAQFEIVAICANALEARSYLQKESVDLLFLDIEMPLIKGTDFFKSLQQKPKVIFTTAFRNYAIDGFDLNAIDYLLKPILLDRFMQAIDKFLLSQNNTQNQISSKSHIFVQSNKKNIKVELDDILFVEGLKDYIQIQLIDQKLTVKHGLSNFANQLGPKFIRVHRSYIVNLDKITAFTKQDVEIGAKEIPIGASYKEQVLAALK